MRSLKKSKSLKDGLILIDKENLEGVIPVLKSSGMTSHDVVNRLRRLLGIKRIGHAGTLDPEATGVLPICIGNATRISEYLMEFPKTYQGQLTLGISTTTQDFTGEMIEEQKIKGLTLHEIEEVFHSFIGEIEQIPPMYSSVKIGGKKLYELARKGKEIERKPRKVMIYDLKILNADLLLDYPRVEFEVSSSKGTYIRTLCVDIGHKLGYPAHMSCLKRVKSGSFTLKESYSLEEIEQIIKEGRLNEILVSIADSLPQYKEAILSEIEIHHKVLNGQKLELSLPENYEGIVKITDPQGKCYALYEKSKNEKKATPKKVFASNADR